MMFYHPETGNCIMGSAGSVFVELAWYKGLKVGTWPVQHHEQIVGLVVISLLAFLLQLHKRTVYSVYIVQPRKKDVVKPLLKLLTPARPHSAPFKVSQTTPAASQVCPWTWLHRVMTISSSAESPPERSLWALQLHWPKPANGIAGGLPCLLSPELGGLH